MQYDTIEELMLELALYPASKEKIFKECAGKYIFQNNKENYDWFTVAKDGNCALFTKDGELDDINKVRWINQGMIQKCITKINIPDSVSLIGIGAFSKSNLVSIDIPDSVEGIEENAFLYCKDLTAISIGKNVRYIDSYAFSCTSLISVDIPDSVLGIDYHAFEDCKDLTEVNIGDGVTDIGEYAFAWCDNLEKITFGRNVQHIGKKALFSDYSLEQVIFKGKSKEDIEEMRPYLWDKQFEEYNSGLRKIICEP